MLVALVDSLRQVRTALLYRDRQTLTATLAHQDELASAVADLRRHRQHLQQTLATALDTPAAEVTLPWLARHWDGALGRQLTHSCERLRTLATEVDELNRGNTVLVRHCLDFVQRLLVDLTGGQNSPRYGPAGTPLGAVCGSLLEARG